MPNLKTRKKYYRRKSYRKKSHHRKLYRKKYYRRKFRLCHTGKPIHENKT